MPSLLTLKELDEECALFLAAGKRYWEVMYRAGHGGAVIWCKDTDGFGCIFTRGEYTDTLMQNIQRLGPTVHFGEIKDE